VILYWWLSSSKDNRVVIQAFLDGEDTYFIFIYLCTFTIYFLFCFTFRVIERTTKRHEIIHLDINMYLALKR